MCSDSKKYVKSQIPATNTLTQIEVLEWQLIDIAVNESKTRLKRGRSVSAKDKNNPEEENTRKVSRNLWRGSTHKANNINNWFIQDLCTKSPKNEPPKEETPEELSPEVESPEELSLEEKKVPRNHEISIHYVSIWEILDRNKTVVDNIFSFKVALDITRSNDDEIEPQTVEECRRRNDWPIWKEAI